MHDARLFELDGMMNISIKPAYLDKERSAAYCALSESTLEKCVREETFPKPRLLAGRRVGWLVKELDAWADSRPVSDLAPPPNTGSRKGQTKTPAPALQDERQAA